MIEDMMRMAWRTILVVIALAALLTGFGCTTISSAALSEGKTAVAVVQGDVAQWGSMTDAQKLLAHQKVGLALADVVKSADGTPVPSSLVPATSDAMALPASSSK